MDHYNRLQGPVSHPGRLGSVMASDDENNRSPLPMMLAFGTGSFMALGFGAGFGAKSFSGSSAYKDLVEKFPNAPTADAEALARRGAGRAFMAGTALAGAMGLGAVGIARLYGIKSAQDFGEEIQRWLPGKDQLKVKLDNPSQVMSRSSVLPEALHQLFIALHFYLNHGIRVISTT